MHQENNETQILIAKINSIAEQQRMSIMNHDNAEANDIEREKMSEEARQFDAKLREESKHFNDKLALDKKRQQDDARLKEKQISKNVSKK